MSGNLKDILNNSNKDTDNQQLMDYLSSQLNQPQQHELEKTMADDAFVNDAVEGLQQTTDKQNLQAYVEQLNEGLQKQISKNKQRKEKRRLKDSPFNYLIIIILLILVVISYLVLKKFWDAKKDKPASVITYTLPANNKPAC